MDTNNARWSDKYDSWASKKPDMYLVEVLRGQDQQENDLAMRILQNRYDYKIGRFVSSALPPDWVPDVSQEIWTAVFEYVRVKEVKVGFSSLLMGIVRHKRADAVDRLMREREIEYDLFPVEDVSAGESESLQRHMEEVVEAKAQRQFLPQIPYTDFLLSDCQRMFWIFREQYKFSSRVIGRLTGKRLGNINQAILNARAKVKKYFHNEDFYIHLANQESTTDSIHHPFTSSTSQSVFIVERFTNPLTPKFTEEEYERFGLKVLRGFQDVNVITGLILPGPRDAEFIPIPTPGEIPVPITTKQLVESKSIYILIALRPELARIVVDQAKARRHPCIGSRPRELLVRIDVEETNLMLRYQTHIEFPFFARDEQKPSHIQVWPPFSRPAEGLTVWHGSSSGRVLTGFM